MTRRIRDWFRVTVGLALVVAVVLVCAAVALAADDREGGRR